jgi:hypothetical protein
MGSVKRCGQCLSEIGEALDIVSVREIYPTEPYLEIILVVVIRVIVNLIRRGFL